MQYVKPIPRPFPPSNAQTALVKKSCQKPTPPIEITSIVFLFYKKKILQRLKVPFLFLFFLQFTSQIFYVRNKTQTAMTSMRLNERRQNERQTLSLIKEKVDKIAANIKNGKFLK